MTEVAVTGFQRSGKTAFLTSLYWNIQYQFNLIQEGETASFSILNDYKDIREINVCDNSFLSMFQKRVDLNPFCGEEKIKGVQNGKFPAKTKDSESFAFDLLCNRNNFNPKKWMNKILPRSIDFDPRYLFVDFPGERISDAYIAKFEKYEDWSYSILSSLGGEAFVDYRELSAKYRELLDDTSTLPTTLVLAYKELLCKLLRYGSFLITPSSFKLSVDGVVTNKINLDSAVCGLDSNSQFVPLSEKWKDTDIYKTMQKHYKSYRTKIVSPLFNVIDTADVLLVLIDITDILTSGYDCYKSQKEFLDTLLSLCKPSPLNPFKLWSVKKVAFIATQCDRVVKHDVENLKSLLEELTSQARKKLKNEFNFNSNNVKCFYCSAFQSTIDGSEPNTLRAYLKGVPVEYEVPAIPKSFPKGKWSETLIDEKNLPARVDPLNLYRNNQPPISVNIDKILEFILG